VAKGAALFADGVLNGDLGTLALDVLPVSLGVDTGGDRISVVLERGATFPVGRKSSYPTATDNQAEMYLRLVQGDGLSASSFRFLGNYKLVGVPPARKGQTRVEASFQVQGDGLLELSAKELVSGKPLTVILEDGALPPVPAELGVWVRELLEGLGEVGGGGDGKAKGGPPPPAQDPSRAGQPGERAFGDQGEETLGLIRGLIPVLDNLNLALSYADPKDESVANLAHGVEMTLKGFLGALGKHGVKEIQASPGDGFDPNFQEAMGFEPPPAEGLADGVVARMVNRGYLLNSMLLRPIQVTLVKKGQGQGQ
jgi:hypothetical protein